MTNVKCIRCGALNFSNAQICKVCEIELNPVRPLVAPAATFVFHHEPTIRWDNANRGSPIIGPLNEVSDILGPTLNLFKNNFWFITKIVVVIVAPFEIFKALNIESSNPDWQLASAVFLLDLLCKILIAPALIYSLMQVMQTGIAPGINEAFRWGFSKLGKVAVAVALASVLEGLGLLLCLIPGFILMMSFMLVEPVAVLEKGSALNVLGSSYDLTKGHRWTLLGASIITWIVIGFFSLPEWATQGVAPHLWPVKVLAAIFVDIFEQAATVLALVTYLSIRALWSQSTQ